MKLRGYLKNPNIILTGKEYPVTVQYALEPDLRELVISFGKKRDKNSIPYYLVKAGFFIWIFYVKSPSHKLPTNIDNIRLRSDKFIAIKVIPTVKRIIENKVSEILKSGY